MRELYRIASLLTLREWPCSRRYPYVLYRVDRYNYRYYYECELGLFWGRFSGSNVPYVNYYSYDGGTFSRGSGDVDLVPDSYAIYTNMDEAYSSFPAERVVFYEKALLFQSCCPFVFAVLRLIFFRRRMLRRSKRMFL